MNPDKKDIKYNTKHDEIIEVANLNKSFVVGNKEIKALKNINLKVHATDFLLIFGPSGCGKSTLLNIISGLDSPTSGSVEVRDVNIFGMNDDSRGVFRSKKMGVIHQMSNWIRSLTVLENVALPLIIEGISEKSAVKTALQVMADMKIEYLAKQKPTQLSGGEQQRASLARALTNSPWIILADEPTGNLDSTSSDQIMGIFDYLNKKLKRTIILVTHNQAYWSIGTRRVEMKDGMITRDVQNISWKEDQSLQTNG